jgi:hypothetical protein
VQQLDEPRAAGLTTIDPEIDRAIVGALRGQDLSGFEIWHWLGSGESVPGPLTEADLYPTLYRLEAEGVIAGAWYQGERTRRRYRLKAKALELPEKHGGHRIAFRGRPGEAPESSPLRYEPESTHRTHSPDPDSAIALCVGAFVAGRMSLGQMARISRHSDAAFRTRWSLGGAAGLLAVVLVVPCHPDLLVVATLFAVPLAFIAGTFRPKHDGEDLYSLRALGLAGLVMVAVVFMPAVRLFAYDPNGTPGTPFGASDSFSYLVIEQHTDGTFDYSTEAAPADSTSFELWPASTDGFYIVVDRSATRSAIVVTRAVDLATLPPSGQWWVVAVEKNADGKRTAVAITIQAGAIDAPNTAMGWLVSRL